MSTQIQMLDGDEDTAVTTYVWCTCFNCGNREPSRDLEDVGREYAEAMHLCDECLAKVESHDTEVVS